MKLKARSPKKDNKSETAAAHSPAKSSTYDSQAIEEIENLLLDDLN